MIDQPPAEELCIDIREPADVVMARKHVRELAFREGLGEAAVWAIATAVTEIAQNILVHAGSGEITIGASWQANRKRLVVAARDEGPGIPDAERAMQDGYSTGGGLGLGLSTARRLVDEFELSTGPGRGTVVTMAMWMR